MSLDDVTKAPIDDPIRVDVYLDGAAEPIVSYRPPVNFELDTTQLEDGEHHLRVEAFDEAGAKGVRDVKFTVRNGPGIDVRGIKQGDVVDGKVPVIVNSYSGATEKVWEPSRAETPAPIPTWTWVVVLFIVGFGFYYAITNWTPNRNFVDSPTFGGSGTVTASAPAPQAPATPAATDTESGSGDTAADASGGGTAVSTAAGSAGFGTNCSSCHQANGQGLPGVFPPLAGSETVLDPDPTDHIDTVLHGKQGGTIGGVTYASPMPAFAGQLDDQTIADIINHERASWGNSTTGVTAEDVAALR